MKILIVHPTLGIGGAETQLLNLSRFLVSRGHDVGIATLYLDPEVRARVPKQIQMFVSESQFLPQVRSETISGTLGILREAMHLRSIVARAVRDYSIINVHNFPATWTVPDATPTLWMCNEPPGLWSNPSSNSIIKFLERLGRTTDKRIVRKKITEIAVIDMLNHRRVIARYGVSPHVVLSGVDYNFFARGDGSRFRSKFGIHDRTIICQVGWLTPQKDQMQSIRVIERLRQPYPGLTLVLCGMDRSAYADELKRYVRDRKLDNQIIFTGRIASEEVADLYNASFAVLFPTMEQSWGLSPLEGACAGALPIVSGKAGVADFVKSREIGLVTDDYSGAVVYSLRHEDERATIVARAKSIIRNELSWEGYGSRMEGLLERCLQRRTRS